MAEKPKKPKKTVDKEKATLTANGEPVGFKNPPLETRWKKGQSGNIAGKPPDPPGMNLVRKLTREELAEMGSLIVKGDMDKLQRIADEALIPSAEKKKPSVLKVMLAKIALKIIHDGDMKALDVLLNRLVGKVKDEIDMNANVNLPQVIVTLPSNGREAKK